MFTVLSEHFIAILLAAATSMAVGAFWYHPKFLGTEWAKAHRLDSCQTHPTWKCYASAFGLAFVTAWAMAWIFNHQGITTIVEGWVLMFWIWLGFVATTQFSGVIWAKKPIKAYAIDVGFNFFAYMAMVVIYGIAF